MKLHTTVICLLLLFAGCATEPERSLISHDGWGSAPIDPKKQISEWIDMGMKGHYDPESIWCDTPGRAYLDGGIFSSKPRFVGYACMFSYKITAKFEPFPERVFMAFFVDGQLAMVSRLAGIELNLHFADKRTGFRAPPY